MGFSDFNIMSKVPIGSNYRPDRPFWYFNISAWVFEVTVALWAQH